MRFKNIRIYFYIALATVVFVRFLQFFHSIDTVTGFIKPAYKLIGYGLLALIFLVAFSVTVISLFIRRCPVKMPRINYVSGMASLVLALCILYDLWAIKTSASIPVWQTGLLKITGALAAVFFGALFVKSLKNFSIPSICFVAPVIYYLVRLVYLFTASSVIALISDNLLSLASCIFTVLFMFEFCLAKMENDGEMPYKKIAATGFTAVILSVATAVPQVAAFVFNKPMAQRVDLPESLLTLFTGIFILLFLRKFFSGRNVRKRTVAPDFKKNFSVGKTSDEFYTG